MGTAISCSSSKHQHSNRSAGPTAAVGPLTAAVHHSWGNHHRRRKGSVVGGHHGECGAQAYNGGLGAEPPAGSRVRAPGQGVKGRSPPEAESILVIGCPTEPANLAPVHENSIFVTVHWCHWGAGAPRLRRLWEPPTTGGGTYKRHLPAWISDRLSRNAQDCPGI